MIIYDAQTTKSTLVSVIITSYNQASTIAKTLDSVLNQKTNYTYEIIIGDDCSTDNSREICLQYSEKYPHIIKPIFHKKNMGVGGNFATCSRAAEGKYIAICAADDFWHNRRKLQLQVDFMEENLKFGLLYTDYNKLNVSNDKLVENYLKKSGISIYQGTGLINEIFTGKVPILTLTVMFRKILFDKYIPVDDYIKFRFSLEDWPTWLILSKYTSIGYLPVSTATYLFGHESITNPISYEKIEKRLENEHIMFKYLCDMFPSELKYNEIDYRIYMYGIYLNLAYKKIDYLAAKKYASVLIDLKASNRKIKMTRTYFGFHLFASLKYIKK